ncbi:MarR family transcriptional regulator [Clostridium sp.]|uniref:MarR family winged helix-turn-helix transcriptional regulator n=1 Tax=Clostridium sp. TaxID=1506 RepID=UPI0032178432
MDETKRYITKISRVAQMYTNDAFKDANLSPSEYVCLRYIRKNEGLNQETLRDLLSIDKSAVTRLVINLEKKGYIFRRKDEEDKRSNKLFSTEKTKDVKMIATSNEAYFYQWLMEDIDEESKEIFLKVLEKLYVKSKNERRANFKNIKNRGGEHIESIEH